MLKLEPNAVGDDVSRNSGLPLAVICSCEHSAFLPLRVARIVPGDQRRLYDLPIVCENSGRREFTLYLIESQEHMEQFRLTLPPRPNLIGSHSSH
jgi:hypothetical protein